MEAGSNSKSELDIELVEEPKSETKPVIEGTSLQQTPSPSKNVERTGGNYPLSTPPSRVAFEHSYAKLVPSRSSPCTGNKDSSFSTVVLFSDRVSSKFKKKGLKGKKRSTVKHGKVKLEEVHSSHGEASNEEGELSAASVPMEVEPPRYAVGKGYPMEQAHLQIIVEYSDQEMEDIIDVTTVDPVLYLPYDEKKVCSSYLVPSHTKHVYFVGLV